MQRSRQPTPPLNLAVPLEIPYSIALIVAWRHGRHLEGGEIRVNETVAAYLRQACKSTLDGLSGADLRFYNADMHLEVEEALFIADADLVANSPLHPVLFADHPLPTINARSLPDRALVLYAVTFTDNERGRIAFVRKTNPRRGARPGRLFALLGNALTDPGKPIFTLDPLFDLVVTPHGVFALDQNVFELMFKETDAVLSLVPEWAESIADHLPLAGDGAEHLAEKAQKSSRLRRRLRAIHERGHLADVTIDRICEHLQQIGLPEDEFIENGQLRVEVTDPLRLLDLLNEDLFVGGLTSTGFRSERKSPRQ